MTNLRLEWVGDDGYEMDFTGELREGMEWVRKEVDGEAGGVAIDEALLQQMDVHDYGEVDADMGRLFFWVTE